MKRHARPVEGDDLELATIAQARILAQRDLGSRSVHPVQDVSDDAPARSHLARPFANNPFVVVSLYGLVGVFQLDPGTEEIA